MKHNLICRMLLTAVSLGLALAPHALAAAAGAGDLPRLAAEAARYESGQSVEALRQLEILTAQSVQDPALRRAVEDGLIQILQSEPTYEAQLFACRQLAVIGTDTSLSALAALLESDRTAGIACFALANHPSGRANAILRRALPKLEGVPLVQVIHTLGDRRDAEAVGALIELARHRDPAIAGAAVAALGKIGGSAAAQAVESLRRTAGADLLPATLEASLRIAERFVEANAIPAAERIYQSLLGPELPAEIRRGAFHALIQLDPERGEERVLQALRDGDPVLRPVAIAAVAGLQPSTASRTFARELPLLPSTEQIWLIESLVLRADADARVAVERALSNQNRDVRLAAIAGTGQLGDAATVAALTRTADGARDPEERRAVELALARLSGRYMTDTAMVSELKRAGADAKPVLIAALARRECQSAIPALLDETSSPAPGVAKAAFQALSQLATAEHLGTLVDRLIHLGVPDARADAEAAVAQAAARSGDPQPMLGALAGTLDSQARCSLLRTLPVMATAIHADSGAAERHDLISPLTPALDALAAACADSDSKVRDAAARALADWPTLDAWDPLLGVLRKPENASHRVLALRALVRLAGAANARPGPELIAKYRTLLELAQTDEDRRLILGALGGLADPEALPLVYPWLDQAGVRSEAEQALKRIAEAIKAAHPEAAAEALRRTR